MTISLFLRKITDSNVLNIIIDWHFLNNELHLKHPSDIASKTKLPSVLINTGHLAKKHTKDDPKNHKIRVCDWLNHARK